MKRFLIRGVLSLAALAAAPAHANSVTLPVGTDSINYVSDGTSENVLIRDDPASGNIGIYNDVSAIGTFELGVDTQLYFGPARRVINIQTGGGTDIVNYVLLSNYNGTARAIQLDFGAAETQPIGAVPPSSFTFDTAGFQLIPNGAIGSVLDFEIAGGGNPENVSLNFDLVVNSKISINEELGLGDDSSTLDLGAAGLISSSLDAQINLGGARISNSATLRYSAPEISSNVNTDVIGGAQPDFISSFYTALHSTDRHTADVSGGGGNDQIISTLDYNTFIETAGSELHITQNGDDGSDTVSVERIDGVLGQLLGLLEISLNGGAGNDQVGATLANPGTFSGGFFGVGGTLRVRADGGAGSDGVTFIAGAQMGASYVVDAVLRGGAGTDNLRSEFYATLPTGFNTTTNFGPLQTILLDGGSDPDQATTFSSGIVAPFTVRSANP